MIADLVKERMRELGRSQAEIARLSGLSTGHVSDIVNGRKGAAVSLPTIQALARGLDVKADYFFSSGHSLKRVENTSSSTKKRAARGGASV
ncbi:hypothetical protein DAETH_28510 [Deinococcus aetherius]|uniref:HTH cro/C1-type domain-containing protein n=1 Tax=Deinococcus aetherius TaxID=200252 RepID=A0ABM8AGF1_9DEIO|nr:hypothetical protein DAETH_28510 [Deinococcus aetherius]